MAIRLVYSYTIDIVVWPLSLSSSITLNTPEIISAEMLNISQNYLILYIMSSPKESVK
jgi:hypothetical protein